MKRNLWLTILMAGLLVATLDITAAIIKFYIDTGKNPVIVLKYIASAVFGKKAYAGDAMMPVWGLIFHYMIAYIWTIFFFLVYPKLKLLTWNWVLTGIAFGILIWIIMNQAVVPLSNASTGAFNLKQAIIAALILIVAIGLPLSFIANRFYSGKLQIN